VRRESDRVFAPYRLFADVGRLASLLLQSHATLAAWNVFKGKPKKKKK